MDPDARVAAALRTFADPSACIAELLCDRHPADSIAVTVIDENLARTDATFGELQASSRQVAGALAGLGVMPGDRVATLMGKGIDLVTVMLGTWRLGAVYVPLFTAFAPQAIAMRLEGSATKVVVTDAAQRPKLEPATDVLVADIAAQVVMAGHAPVGSDDLRLSDLIASASPEDFAVPAAVGGEGPIVHMFTSGTTGKPKGVVHPLSYLASWQIYLEFALGLTDDDVLWLAADPGWAYGLYGAIAGPLAAGRRVILYAGLFDLAKTWQVLVDCGVTNFVAAPTVYRALRAAGQHPEGLRLKRASSGGEPLTAEVNEWARETLGIEVHDHYGQTELGMVLANHHHPALEQPITTGSMGRAIPGWKLIVLEPNEDIEAGDDKLGRLAVDVSQSPLMTFRAYDGRDPASSGFTEDGRFFLTGDTARVDSDGNFFFSARDDDVIIMAGYRIGPFEIETVLAQHASVAECAVIAAPDTVRGEVLEAYVVPRDGVLGSEDLASALQLWVKERYAAHAYPRTVHFVEALPKTPSGKIQRFLLRRQREKELAETVAS